MSNIKQRLYIRLSPVVMDRLRMMYDMDKSKGAHGNKRSLNWYVERIISNYIMDNLRISKGKQVNIEDIDLSEFEM